jgi:hypothetical protein
VWDQDLIREIPGAAGREQSEQQYEFRSLRQTVHGDGKRALLEASKI